MGDSSQQDSSTESLISIAAKPHHKSQSRILFDEHTSSSQGVGMAEDETADDEMADDRSDSGS
jgi:hypothetical protein